MTEIIGRKYFQSIYSREPGGVLFEIATTGAGFTVDESLDELGSSLTLPEWLRRKVNGLRNSSLSSIQRRSAPAGTDVARDELEIAVVYYGPQNGRRRNFRRAPQSPSSRITHRREMRWACRNPLKKIINRQ
ncbi:hypothetical protein A4G99_20650 [Haladaptatus sp. R4]|nr:hypothetical protein A4G99_20650 [Haladaptatus sp. R4]